MKNFKIFLISLLGILLLSSCGWWKSAVIPPDECFETDGEIITKYDLENEKCPTDIIIPEKIKGVVITEIWIWAFTNPNFENIENIEGIENLVKNNCFRKTSKECYILLNEIKNKDKSKKIETLFLWDNIQNISGGAFSWNNIKNIKFWKWLRNIGELAFFANNLTLLDFSNLSNPINIADSSSFSNNKIKTVIIPKKSSYNDIFLSDVEIIEINLKLTKEEADIKRKEFLQKVTMWIKWYLADYGEYPEKIEDFIPSYVLNIELDNSDKNITDKCYTEIQYKRIDKDNYEVSICLEGPKDWENKVYTLRN